MILLRPNPSPSSLALNPEPVITGPACAAPNCSPQHRHHFLKPTLFLQFSSARPRRAACSAYNCQTTSQANPKNHPVGNLSDRSELREELAWHLQRRWPKAGCAYGSTPGGWFWAFLSDHPTGGASESVELYRRGGALNKGIHPNTSGPRDHDMKQHAPTTARKCLSGQQSLPKLRMARVCSAVCEN